MKSDAAERGFEQLPSVDRLLNLPLLQDLIMNWGRASVQAALRAIQASLRANGIDRHHLQSVEGYYRSEAELWLSSNRARGYERVFNLTGTILHTNFGRALIADELFERVKTCVTHPASIEFDLDSGTRGEREKTVCDRLCRLVDAESAAIVNNNAAAVLIALHTFALGRSVVVSRGELIEIGGSFRLPEIMASAGCNLVEVGTTNRTHFRDYERALKTNPALLLKIHPSNYRMDGFTKSVSTRELRTLAKAHDIPCVVDLGSGALVDTRKFGLPPEPMPGDVLKAGADLVTFSGDKLLGGPQAGLIVGSKEMVNAINANPMKRALRTSKLTLALLDETLKAYEDMEHVRDNIPTLRMVDIAKQDLEKRAREIHSCLALKLPSDVAVEIRASEAEVGSGTMPGHHVPSVAVVLRTKTNSMTSKLSASLRQLPIPVIGRIYKGALYLDMHGAEPLDEVLANLNALP